MGSPDENTIIVSSVYVAVKVFAAFGRLEVKVVENVEFRKLPCSTPPSSLYKLDLSFSNLT